MNPEKPFQLNNVIPISFTSSNLLTLNFSSLQKPILPPAALLRGESSEFVDHILQIEGIHKKFRHRSLDSCLLQQAENPLRNHLICYLIWYIFSFMDESYLVELIIVFFFSLPLITSIFKKNTHCTYFSGKWRFKHVMGGNRWTSWFPTCILGAFEESRIENPNGHAEKTSVWNPP